MLHNDFKRDFLLNIYIHIFITLNSTFDSIIYALYTMQYVYLVHNTV